MALLRVGLSSIAITNYVIHLSTSAALWGPAGQLDFPTFAKDQTGGPFALFRYSPSTLYSEAIVILALVVAIAFALGIRTRVVSWLFVITAYAVAERNWAATDAGSTLLILIAFLLCFADTSRYFAWPSKSTHEQQPMVQAIGTMLHNSARFLIAWQLCMVYYWAAFYKLGGHDWRTGVALHYVFETERFMVAPWLTTIVADNSTVVAAVTFFTLVFQTGFPFLMWNKRVKPYLVAIAALMHIGIAVSMGLISFSLTMIVLDLSILSDEQFLAAVSFLRKSAQRAVVLFRQASVPATGAVELVAGRAYDERFKNSNTRAE